MSRARRNHAIAIGGNPRDRKPSRRWPARPRTEPGWSARGIAVPKAGRRRHAGLAWRPGPSCSSVWASVQRRCRFRVLGAPAVRRQATAAGSREGYPLRFEVAGSQNSGLPCQRQNSVLPRFRLFLGWYRSSGHICISRHIVTSDIHHVKGESRRTEFSGATELASMVRRRTATDAPCHAPSAAVRRRLRRRTADGQEGNREMSRCGRQAGFRRDELGGDCHAECASPRFAKMFPAGVSDPACLPTARPDPAHGGPRALNVGRVGFAFGTPKPLMKCSRILCNSLGRADILLVESHASRRMLVTGVWNSCRFGDVLRNTVRYDLGWERFL